MISVTYPNGKVRQFDAIPSDEVSRHTLVSSMMTVREMRRFFIGRESQLVAVALGLSSKGTEASYCADIYKYFNGGS